MSIEFSEDQRRTLRAVVDTFVASVPVEDDPTGFYAVKGSDVGADVAVEHYLVGNLPEEQLAGLLQLLDAAAQMGMEDQSQAVRESVLSDLAGIAPEAAGAIAALQQLSIMMSYGLADGEGNNPLWAGMEYPGMIQAPPDIPKTLEVIRPSADTTLEADVVVVGSGSGGGVAAGELAAGGKKVIVLEAGGYFNESDFVQSELLAYQNLFLRGGFFPTADGMVNIAAGATVGGGSTVNWSNSVRTPQTVRNHWAENHGLTDVAGPEFDEHLDAVWSRIKANSEVATQNRTHERLGDAAAKLGYHYAPTDLNIDAEHYDPAVSGYSGLGDQSGAKQSTMRTYLQDASDAGAKLLPDTKANRITTEGGKATGVEATYVDRETQKSVKVVIRAESVVVAGGSMETPALLLRSEIGGPAVGAELRLHPASLVSGIYEEPQDPWYGPAQAGIMSEFAEATGGFGFIVEGVQHLPGLFNTVGPWLSAVQHKELTKRYIGTAPTGCSSSRTGAPAASRSMNQARRSTGIPSTTSSTGVTSVRPPRPRSGCRRRPERSRSSWQASRSLRGIGARTWRSSSSGPASCRSVRWASRCSARTRCVAPRWARIRRPRWPSRPVSCMTPQASGLPTPARCRVVPGSTRW